MANRRDFIKISGLGLGGLAISASGLGVYRNLTTSPPVGEEMNLNLTRTPTICEICFWKCAGWVYKNEEGKIWKVVGNDEDQHSNGRFCPRGTGGPGMSPGMETIPSEAGPWPSLMPSWVPGEEEVDSTIRRLPL